MTTLSSPDGGGWQFLDAVTEQSDFQIDGLSPWDEEWRKVDGMGADVRDPAYGQNYRFQVYEIGAIACPVRFAAGEFSNGVWGFYVPAAFGRY